MEDCHGAVERARAGDAEEGKPVDEESRSNSFFVCSRIYHCCL